MEEDKNQLSVCGSPHNVNKLKNFYQSLSGSDISNMRDKNARQVARSPPKPRPAIPPKPCIKPANKSPPRTNHFDLKKDDTKQTPPEIAAKPKRSPNNTMENHENLKEEKECKEGKENGECQEGNEETKETEDAEVVGEEDEDDDNAWPDSDFESDNDSDREQQFSPNKRASRIIFDGLEDIPDVFFNDPRKRKLYNIAKEILTTEITYVKTLKLLDEGFHFNLDNECRAKNLISKEALVDIFSYITSINQFHRDFLLPKLEERMKTWHLTPRVGDIFNSLAPFLKMYAEYVKNFDKAMASLAKWKTKSPKFAAIIEEIQKTNTECNNLTLEHHMLAPIQRVPRYKLLLTDYISKLPEDSPDLEVSQKALEIIASAANHANESMKKTERFQKMLDMQDKFGDGISIVTPSREFIMEGELVKISARNAQPMPRILVLFNDALYYCTKVPATGKYKVKQTAELLFSQVEETEEEIANRELVFRVYSKRQVTDFLASSVEEKEKWVEALRTAIENAVSRNNSFGREEVAENELGKVAPVWVKDAAVSMCMECTIAFTTLKRRHHCRACGKIVCNNCSSYKAPLEYDDNKMNRVCFTCHRILTKGETKKKKKRTSIRKVHVYADSVLNGYLNFRAENSKTWAKRWCNLGQDFTLLVFRAKKDVKAQATIPLPGFELEDHSAFEETEKNGKYFFKVSHKGYGSFQFEAENSENLERWFQYIRCAIAAEAYPSSDTSAPTASDPPSTPTSPVAPTSG